MVTHSSETELKLNTYVSITANNYDSTENIKKQVNAALAAWIK